MVLISLFQKKICSTGFAYLSSIDEGWYGKGVYFTSSARYATPYFAVKQDPTIIIALVLPGNTYPVTEHPKEVNNIIGQALKSGFQSHYVVTSKAGYPIQHPTEKCYDELVISQEAQVVPVFILVIDKSNIQELVEHFQRMSTVVN